jgi:hypothetical protein
VALVDTGESWKVLYGDLLLTDKVIFHENDKYNAVQSVFEIIGASLHFPLLRIGENKDAGGFFVDGSETDCIAQARKREFVGVRLARSSRQGWSWRSSRQGGSWRRNLQRLRQRMSSKLLCGCVYQSRVKNSYKTGNEQSMGRVQRHAFQVSRKLTYALMRIKFQKES